MRASTVRCRVLDRCGDSLGVEISFKDVCILAAVSNSRCRIRARSTVYHEPVTHLRQVDSARRTHRFL